MTNIWPTPDDHHEDGRATSAARQHAAGADAAGEGDRGEARPRAAAEETTKSHGRGGDRPAALPIALTPPAGR